MPAKYTRRSERVSLVTLVLILPLLFPDNAHAYLDPGTGSFILQAAVAVLLAGAVTLKHSWHRIRSFFRGSSRERSDLDLDD